MPSLARVVEPHRARLDGDPALALEIHRIEELLLQLALRERAGALQQPIGQRRLAVIDMRDNREISNQFAWGHLVIDARAALSRPQHSTSGVTAQRRRQREASTLQSRRSA